MSLDHDEDTKMADHACGMLWEVYLGEAQRYDDGLVKSWKEDMDVTLVFSGLYSAVLTAFVIESYKNLQPDQSQLTSSLLLHISEQLANNGGIAATTPHFAPDASALACNILWFFSLILSISCAFLATFVQQWSRNFLHRTTIIRTPTARARLVSFLYFGLKNFKMHTIVNLIPSLLHLSLFAFLGGLVAFLHTVNSALRWLLVGGLVVITFIYTVFTLLPLIRLSSPYQTPLSPIVWRMWQSLGWSLERLRVLRQNLFMGFARDSDGMLPVTREAPSSQRRKYNLFDAMIAASSIDREPREAQSLSWALRSLTDDDELLPFIEALPDVIYGFNGKLHTQNFHLLRPILETSDPSTDIISRTFTMMRNSHNYWVTEAHRKRCSEAIPSAFWALAYLLNNCPDDFSPRKAGRSTWFTVEQLDEMRNASNWSTTWRIPVLALVKSNIHLSGSYAPSSVDSVDSEKASTYSQSRSSKDIQAQILVNYLEGCSNATVETCMFISTFYSLRGHERTWQLPYAWQNLLDQLRKMETDENLRGMITYFDDIFQKILPLSASSNLNSICQYINSRTAYTSDTWIWFRPRITEPRWQSRHRAEAAYRHFLRAVIDDGIIDWPCLNALRNILWCFNKYNSNDITPEFVRLIDHDWWSDVDPLWIEVLDCIDAIKSDDSTHSDRQSLLIMIKAMVLKKRDPHTIPEVGVRSGDFDLPDFIHRYISQTIEMIDEPTPQDLKLAYSVLVIHQLRAMGDAPDPIVTIGDVRATLNYIPMEQLFGMAYLLPTEFALQLAKETERACKDFSEHSETLRVMLDNVWVLWEPKAGDRQPIGTNSICEEAACAIARAARAVLGAYERTGSESDSLFEGMPFKLLRERITSAVEFWEEEFPYILPLPPYTESELDEAPESVGDQGGATSEHSTRNNDSDRHTVHSTIVVMLPELELTSDSSSTECFYHS